MFYSVDLRYIHPLLQIQLSYNMTAVFDPNGIVGQQFLDGEYICIGEGVVADRTGCFLFGVYPQVCNARQGYGARKVIDMFCLNSVDSSRSNVTRYCGSTLDLLRSFEEFL